LYPMPFILSKCCIVSFTGVFHVKSMCSQNLHQKLERRCMMTFLLCKYIDIKK
jgi:Na+/H+-translocating membrane pyrophosphatase